MKGSCLADDAATLNARHEKWYTAVGVDENKSKKAERQWWVS